MADLLGGGAKRRLPRMKPALARMAERALVADEDEIRSYNPAEIDLQIAESLMSGVVTFKDIAANIGCDAAHVSRAMKDPVRCGWICEQLHRVVHRRIGLVDNALLLRALSGDVRAMDLYYKRFGEMKQRNVHIHGHIGLDPSKLTDADLDAVIASEQSRTLEADYTVKEDPCPDSPPTQSPPSE